MDRIIEDILHFTPQIWKLNQSQYRKFTRSKQGGTAKYCSLGTLYISLVSKVLDNKDKSQIITREFVALSFQSWKGNVPYSDNFLYCQALS